MPDASPTDATAILKQLEDLIERNKADAGGSKSWISTVIILATVLVATAIYSIVSWFRDRELARLRHEQVKAQVEADNAAMAREVAKNQADIEQLKAAEAKAMAAAEIAAAAVKDLEARRAADEAVIDHIRSWDDVAHRDGP